MKNEMTRIFNNKKKIATIIILILLPSVEVLFFVYDYLINGLSFSRPLYATFLSLSSRIHILQSLYLWFLPLYFLIIVGDDCIQDYQTGYKNILLCKVGKNNYIKNKLKAAFSISFFVMIAGLFLNLILVQIVCHGGLDLQYGGTYMVYDARSMPETLLFEFSYTHPLAVNIIYIIFTSFFAGLIGMVGTSLAIALHDRKTVYAITFAIWFIPILFKRSFMLIFQPFSEYGIKVVLPLTICIGGFYILIIAILMIWEAKFVEI